MTTEPTGAATSGLVDRVKNILLTPQAEWDKIDTEAADVNKIYVGYVLPLAALAAICAFIGMSVFGASAFGVTYRVPMVTGLVGAVLQVGLGLAGVFLLAFITNALAPTFGSQQNMGQAHKLAAYGSTAGFLAGVFTIFPPLAILGLVGLYSLYLLYVGLPKMMKTPQDKRIGYFVTIILVAIVAQIIIGVVVGSVQRTMGGVGAPSYSIGQSNPSPDVQGEVTLPGGGSINLDDMQRQAEALQNGGGTAIDPMALQQRLPQALPGGFTLASTSSGAAMGSAQAEGEYTSGDARIRVNVVHMGAMGAIAGMAVGMNVQENQQDANGYSRTQTVNGRVITESVDNSNRSASYGVVGRGVAVTAEGSGGVSVEQVRAVVQAMNIEQLERDFAS